MKNGDYAVKLLGNQTNDPSIRIKAYDSNGSGGTDAGDRRIVGFWTYVPSLDLSTTNFWMVTNADTGTNWKFALTSGEFLEVQFNDGSSVNTVKKPFSLGVWQRWEVIWQELASGAMDIYIDGSLWHSFTGKDMKANLTHTDYLWTGFHDVATGDDLFVDDIYMMSGAAVSDRLSATGNGEWEISRHQSGKTGQTPDNGTNLTGGVWNNAGKTPLDESNSAQYMGTASGSGHVYSDDTASGKHYRHGPHGDVDGEKDGTIVAAKWIIRARKGAFGGTSTKRMRVGSDLGSNWHTHVITLTSAYKNFFDVEETNDVPSKDDHFALGMTKGSDASSFDKNEVAELWAMLLHVPAAAAPAGPRRWHGGFY